jgi:tyrosine-protein kinase Etk/Wzc
MIEAQPGDKFIVSQLTRLQAIADIQEVFNVTDRGKDTGILNLTLTGDNPELISRILIVLVKIILRRILLGKLHKMLKV